MHIGAIRAGEKSPRRWTEAECIEQVAQYLTERGPTERATRRNYLAWASAQGDMPYPATFQRYYGGWNTVRDTAWARLRDGQGFGP